MRIRSEIEIGRAVATYLSEQGWEVFQEVQMGRGGSRADLVARLGHRLWVVECKTTFGLSVLEQADAWRRYANWISVAVPPTRRGAMAVRVAEWLGVGVLCVGNSVEVRVAPRLCRRVIGRLGESLRDEHRTWAEAGSAHGDYWTPFRHTARALAEVVRLEPGISMSAAVKQIKHHYGKDSTAVTSLLNWVHAEKVPGIRAVKNGHRIALHPHTE